MNVVVTDSLGAGNSAPGPKDPVAKSNHKHHLAQPTVISRNTNEIEKVIRRRRYGTTTRNLHPRSKSSKLEMPASKSSRGDLEGSTILAFQ